MDRDHATRHDRLIAAYCARHHLSQTHADRMSARMADGCERYGERNHHAPEFSCAREALEEAWDLVTLGVCVALERREDGEDPELMPAEQRAYAELEFGAAACLRALEVLAGE